MIDESSPSMRLTRQELVRRGLLTSAAVGLAPAFLVSLGAEVAAAAPARADAGTINFFSWQGYDLLDEPAIKAYSAVGFRPIGIMRRAELIDGEWTDGLLMDLLIEELT